MKQFKTGGSCFSVYSVNLSIINNYCKLWIINKYYEFYKIFCCYLVYQVPLSTMKFYNRDEVNGDCDRVTANFFL